MCIFTFYRSRHGFPRRKDFFDSREAGSRQRTGRLGWCTLDDTLLFAHADAGCDAWGPYKGCPHKDSRFAWDLDAKVAAGLRYDFLEPQGQELLLGKKRAGGDDAAFFELVKGLNSLGLARRVTL